MLVSTRYQVAHLLRRAGFGASKADLDFYASLGFEGAVDRLINYQPVDDGQLESVVQRMRAENPAASNEEKPEAGNFELEVAIWLTRMVLTMRPLQEKMTLFWHGLLTSSIVDVKAAPLMYRQNSLYRSNALTTNFKDLVKAVAHDPAMLIYLDNNTNKKGKPNENWARELMELFTLGIGNYTETDVKEGARAFTGWTVSRTGEFVFNRQQHDSDPKTFLGVTGNLDGDDVIDIIFTQPAHGKYMARRLIRFFVFDAPSEEMVNRYASIYVQSGFNVKETVRQLLLSPEFRSEQAYFSIIKSPVEFVVGALRALSASFTDLRSWRAIGQQMRTMGQQVYAPPDVSGWPGNRSWMNSTTFYTRANLAAQLVGIENANTVDPSEIANSTGINTPEAAVDYFLDLLVQGDVPSNYRGDLLKFTGSRFTDARDKDAKLRGLVRLIMSTPAYQMN